MSRNALRDTVLGHRANGLITRKPQGKATPTVVAFQSFSHERVFREIVLGWSASDGADFFIPRHLVSQVSPYNVQLVGQKRAFGSKFRGVNAGRTLCTVETEEFSEAETVSPLMQLVKFNEIPFAQPSEFQGFNEPRYNSAK